MVGGSSELQKEVELFFSRRILLRGLAAAVVTLATSNTGSTGGNGRGGGNGPGGGNGRGNGNGGNGGGGANGGGPGNGNAKGKATGKSNITAPSPSTANPATSALHVRHKNGFEETLSGGRYHLKDNRGRTIVNRPATRTDLARLLRLTGA